MVFVKEQSPQRQWSQFANDLNFYLSDPLSPESPAILNRIDRIWLELEKKEISEMYGGKKRKGVTNSGIKFLLSAFEVDKGELGLSIVCRVLDAVLDVFGMEGDRKKEKGIVKADAIAVLSRATRKRLLMRTDPTKNASQIDSDIDQFFFKFLYTIGLKDNRFNLKIRMSGVIQVMCRLFMRQDTLPDYFLTLFIRVSRSPRNGQLIGRQEGFMNRLLAKISSLNNSDVIENINLLDKHLQVLFFTLKNRRIRIQMIRDSFCRTIIEILKRHINQNSSRPTRILSSIFGTSDPSAASAHAEVTIGCLAILRLLANNKKARDEMIALGTVDICAKELREFSNDEARSGQKIKILDSLSALCLRCMPPIPYPLENVRFPLEFALPQPAPVPGGRVRNSSSINVSFDNGRSSDEDGIDEEDEVFNDHNASSNFEHSDEDEKDDNNHNLPIPRTTKLTAVQLNKYTPFFVENEQGTMSQMGLTRRNGDEESWRSFCEKTKYAMPIKELLPYEMFVGETSRKEGLVRSVNSMRKMIVEELEKSSNRHSKSSRVVYDLDSIAFEQTQEVNFPKSSGKLDTTRELMFESRFESGNLRRATQVAPTHYELVLTPDLNQLREHYQWFFFQVSNMRKGVNYTFEIVNCLKSTSMYSQGMQPVMFSMMDHNSGWKRTGENVCYYRNLYSNDTGTQIDEKNGEDKKKNYYYSVRFDVNFQNTADVCYLAYHFPYTYSLLNTNIHFLRNMQLSAVYCREDVIGHSLAGNPIKILTITSPGTAREVSDKNVIVISARVHPGESNSSWIMQGILESLICGSTPEMYRLRENFVFKIIPMLNPDGVINGSHRCSLAGIDLNRVWDRPNEVLHPEIYHSKAVIQYLCEAVTKKPYAFVDLHGHSKKWDCFVFGNNAAESWRREEIPEGQDEDDHLMLPKALEKTCAGKFNLSECRFGITRAKESSARVNVWRQFGIPTAYTLESTYCGFQMAPNKGFQINIDDLKTIGRDLLCSFLEMSTNK